MRKDNLNLNNYEIKGPDYDLIERKNDLDDNFLNPIRFKNEDGIWKSIKQKKTGLFAKESAKIMITGDITCFDGQIEASKTDDGYDFMGEFQCIKGVFEQSDLTIGNLETMLVTEAPYRTEKYVSEKNYHCNGPVEFAAAVRQAGFDMVTNANNHDMDTGASGIGETIDVINHFGLIQTGTFKEKRRRFEIFEVNGFKVAVTAFATDHNGKRENLTPKGAKFLLNDFTPKRARIIAENAKLQGADVVIACIHWGRENIQSHNLQQEKIANKLAELGYDCIIGSHPHVLQEFEYIVSNGKKVPVFYSLGNFLSHNSKGPKARSAIACLDLTRTKSGVDIAVSYIPIITAAAYNGTKHVVLPISRLGGSLENVKACKLIKNILGKDIKTTSKVRYPNYSEDPVMLVAEEKMNPGELGNGYYTDGIFTYKEESDHMCLTGFLGDGGNLSYTVPDEAKGKPVSEMVNNVFASTKGVKKINFRKNIKTIREGACKGCKDLEGFQFSFTVKELETEAFAECTSLSAAVMNTNLEKIGSRAFAGCTSLRTIKLNNKLKEIATDAFEGCNDATIYCSEGSYGHRFAESNKMKYIIMNIEW